MLTEQKSIMNTMMELSISGDRGEFSNDGAKLCQIVRKFYRNAKIKSALLRQELLSDVFAASIIALNDINKLLRPGIRDVKFHSC